MKIKHESASFTVFGFEVDFAAEIMQDLLRNIEAQSDVVFICLAVEKCENLRLEVLPNTLAGITAWHPHHIIFAIIFELNCNMALTRIVDGISYNINCNLSKPLLISKYIQGQKSFCPWISKLIVFEKEPDALLARSPSHDFIYVHNRILYAETLFVLYELALFD